MAIRSAKNECGSVFSGKGSNLVHEDEPDPGDVDDGDDRIRADGDSECEK